MRTPRFVPILVCAALFGCSLPAPYQTYSPGEVPAATLPTNALIVYGQTTTLPDMVPDSSEIEPLPALAAGTGNTQKSEAVAICYNRLWNKPDAIRSAAAQACGDANMSPRVASQGIDLDACPLLTPTKAVFACGASTAR